METYQMLYGMHEEQFETYDTQAVVFKAQAQADCCGLTVTLNKWVDGLAINGKLIDLTPAILQSRYPGRYAPRLGNWSTIAICKPQKKNQ